MMARRGLRSFLAATAFAAVVLLVRGSTSGSQQTRKVVAAIPSAPVLEPHATLTQAGTITIRGRAGTFSVEVSSPAGRFDVPVKRGRFSAKVSLLQNQVNRIFFTAIGARGVRSPVRMTAITQDVEAPQVFADFQSPGTAPGKVDVAGRVGDRLCGDSGMSVSVNGVEAEVDVGKGPNGTFLARDVPLGQGGGGSPGPGAKTFTVTASDALGNTVSSPVILKSVPPPVVVSSLTPLPNPTKRIRKNQFGTIEVVSGSGQVGPIRQTLADPIVVQIVKPGGAPIANKLVTFQVTSSDGLLSGKRTLQLFTDGQGMAQAPWALGSDAGSGNNRVVATSTDIDGAAAFVASATPGPAAQINVSMGNAQRVQVGGPAPELLRIWVSDACNGVAGVLVNFAVLEGGGTVNGQTQVDVLTNASGYAEVAFTLGPQSGNQLVEATFPGNPTPPEPARFTLYGVATGMPSTSFEGMVLDNAGRPIQGATCTLTPSGGSPLATTTASDGRFSFDNLAAGAAALHVEGSTATAILDSNGNSVPVLPGSFPSLGFDPIVIVQDAANTLRSPILLPQLDPANEVVYDGTQEVKLTVAGIAGLEMRLKFGTKVTHPDGVTITDPNNPNPITLALHQVHFDDVPMPMPDGAAPPFAWTLQPSGATFDPPLEITYPNMSGLPPGALSYFFSFDHDLNRFVIVGTAHAAEDGSKTTSDPGSGIALAGWGGNCPPYSITGQNGHPGSGSVQIAILPATQDYAELDDFVVVSDPLAGVNRPYTTLRLTLNQAAPSTQAYTLVSRGMGSASFNQPKPTLAPGTSIDVRMYGDTASKCENDTTVEVHRGSASGICSGSEDMTVITGIKIRFTGTFLFMVDNNNNVLARPPCPPMSPYSQIIWGARPLPCEGLDPYFNHLIFEEGKTNNTERWTLVPVHGPSGMSAGFGWPRSEATHACSR